MKIIIYVDFKNKDFNKDFTLSQSLLSEHTVLLVTNMEQLRSSIGTYDLILLGFSCVDKLDGLSIPVYDLKTEPISKLKNILN